MQFAFLELLVVHWFQIGCHSPPGCARKQRVSYASIWARTPLLTISFFARNSLCLIILHLLWSFCSYPHHPLSQALHNLYSGMESSLFSFHHFQVHRAWHSEECTCDWMRNYIQAWAHQLPEMLSMGSCRGRAERTRAMWEESGLVALGRELKSFPIKQKPGSIF